MSRRTQDTGRADSHFAYRIITFFDVPSQTTSAMCFSLTFQSYNPNKQACWFGLFPFRSPLLRESIFLSLPAGNEMFQFPACTSTQSMYSIESNIRLKMLGSPIRKSLDHSLLTAPQSISVFVPSFIGS